MKAELDGMEGEGKEEEEEECEEEVVDEKRSNLSVCDILRYYGWDKRG